MHECRSTRPGNQSVEVAPGSQGCTLCLGPLSTLLFSFTVFSDSLLAVFKHLTERGEVPHHKKEASETFPPEGAKHTQRDPVLAAFSLVRPRQHLEMPARFCNCQPLQAFPQLPPGFPFLSLRFLFIGAKTNWIFGSV